MEFTRSRSKNRSLKNWLSLCFKPVTVDDPFEPISQKAKADAVLSTYFGVSDREGGGGGVLPLPTILSSALTTVAECQEGSRGGRRGGRRKKGDDSCLWQVIKKALNETSLAKKMKKRKAAKDQFSRSSSIKSDQKADRNSKEARRTHTELSASSSFRCSSALTQSSLASSTSSSSPSANAIFGSTIKKPEDVKDSRKEHAGSNKALCLLLMISLLVLIVWGKFYAILCTSTWFSLMPRRSRRCYQPGRGEEAELDSVEYKKRIIMEGLLERNRSRVSTDSN